MATRTDSAVRPNDRPVPVRAPLELPHPVLQVQGFNGGIREFNSKVAAVVDEHRHRFGTDPSPSLVLDVAKSPLQPPQYGQLFNIPTSHAVARASGVATQAGAPPLPSWLRSPFQQYLQGTAGYETKPLAPKGKTQAQREYPTVRLGYDLPIRNLADFYAALDQLAGNPSVKVTSHGIDLSGAEKLARESTQTGPVPPMPTGDRNQKMWQQQDYARAQLHVRTIKQAQQDLNREMGTDLPVNGVMNQDWLSTVGNYMKSLRYYQRVAQIQAEQAGFKKYDDFLKALKNKQGSIDRYGPLAEHFLNAQPLHVFAKGTGWGAIGMSALDYIAGPPLRHPWNPLEGITASLHTLTRSAGLALDVIGGGVQQVQADLTASSMLTEELYLYATSNKKPTLDEIKAHVNTAINGNPSWLKIVDPNLALHPESARMAKIDAFTNLAVNLLLVRKPIFTGETVAAGSVAKAYESEYLRASSEWAYRDLERGNIGRAVSHLEGGPGAEQLAVAARPLIKNGKLTQDQFRMMVAEVYANSRTMVEKVPAATPEIEAKRALLEQYRGELKSGFKGDIHEQARIQKKVTQLQDEIRQAPGGGQMVEVQGALFDSMRTNKLPTPGLPGKALLHVRDVARRTADQFDKSLRDSNFAGSDTAANYISTIRQTFSHAAPIGSRHYFDPRLPERVHDFVLKHFKDATLANGFENELIIARAKDSVTGIQRVEEKLTALWRKKHPNDLGPGEENPFRATLVTEAPSAFHFPGGGSPEVDTVLAGMEERAKKFNRALNVVGKRWRQAIISGAPFSYLGGGMSLLWKHVFDDTSRAQLGGAGWWAGRELRGARSEVNKLAERDAEVERALGTFLARSKMSEVRWMTGRGGATDVKSFSTGEFLGKRNYMEAAGGYLRRRLTDDMLSAYRRPDPLAAIQAVLKKRHYRGVFAAAKKAQPELIGGVTWDRARSVLAKPELTEADFAQLIFDQYKKLEGSLASKGVTWDQARNVLAKHRGAEADKALGKFISDNKLDIAVESGQVQRLNLFDEVTTAWIGTLMTANKWNRGRLAENAMLTHYKNFRAAGWEQKDALDVAMSVAEKQVVYHMLDFANMLQVEQDLRWLSFFATKHRLYWKWVIGTLVRRPGVAAVVSEVQQHLNDHGGIDFSAFGKRWEIPAARLFWVPDKEYSEVAPSALALAGLIKTGGFAGAVEAAAGTNGNIFSRNDTTIRLAAKLAKVESGKEPATYGYLTSGVDSNTADTLNKRLNDYANAYYAEHHQFPPEADAVKHVLVSATAEEYWRANLPFPILPGKPENKPQELLREFMGLLTPAKRRKFLDQHPDLQLYFGVYSNPGEYQHARMFWSRYVTALDDWKAVRSKVYEQARRDGMTPELVNARRAADKKFNALYDGLLLQDANMTGEVVDGHIARKGVWGRQVESDPLHDPRGFVKMMFPKIPDKEIEKGVPGYAVQQAKLELKRLNDQDYLKTFGDLTDPDVLDQVKTRKRELLQFIEDFRNFPSDALGKVQLEYQTRHVNPYWRNEEKQYQRIQGLPRDQQTVEYARFREWRDKQDQPVEINGVKFPSPVRMAWATLPPQERQARLARLSASAWDHLTAYEKELLGKPVPKETTAGWTLFAEVKDYYSEQNPGHRLDTGQVQAVVRQIDGKHPGFKADFYFAQEPKLRRFQVTSMYQGMPAASKAKFVKYVATDAQKILVFLRNPDYSKSELRATWRKYVREQITPWLNEPEQTALRQYLVPFGPDFLNTLVSR